MVAGRIATELVMEYRYKMRMLGVLLSGPTYLLGDNMSMILSATILSCTLKKNHNAIAYHRVREAVAAGIVQIAHVTSKDNFADILTKPLAAPEHFNLILPTLFRQRYEILYKKKCEDNGNAKRKFQEG